MTSIRSNLAAVASGFAVLLTIIAALPAADEPPKAPAAAQPPRSDAPVQVPALPPSDVAPPITVSVGKPAPPFVTGTWLKGKPIDALKPGQVYVVEFWATWCPPCIAGMPHISELQTSYGDKVRIVGVSNEEESVVREFLAKDREPGVTFDSAVTYSLAMDAGSALFNTWFRAAGRSGIPCAFIVGKDGVIDWIGHPGRIDEPLAKVVDGTWDRSAAVAEYEVELKRMKAAADFARVRATLLKAVRAKDWDQAVLIADELIKADPDNPMAGLTKLSVLSQSGRTEEASVFMKGLVKADWDKGEILANIAHGIAQASLPGTLDEAERLARRAVELSQEKGPGELHALARVLAEQGKLDDAIATERKALDLADNSVVILRALREYEERRDSEAKSSGKDQADKDQK